MTPVKASFTSFLICYELAFDLEAFTTGTCATAEGREMSSG